jgi:hypothetical protein
MTPKVVTGSPKTPCEFLADAGRKDLEDTAKLRELSAALEQRYRAVEACIDERTKSVGGILAYNLGFDCSSGKKETDMMQQRYDMLAEFIRTNQQNEAFLSAEVKCDPAMGQK